MVFRSDMKVKLVDYHGDDLLVVNAARASFAKRSQWCYEEGQGWVVDYEDGEIVYLREVDNLKALCEKDKRLVRYLAKHNHWTPFGHPHVTFNFEIPVFVARQLMRHNVGIVWNEASRRYITIEPQVYWPKEWRSKPEGNIKQGSGAPMELDFKTEDIIKGLVKEVVAWYNELVEEGVAPEVARSILPVGHYTYIYGTGSLYAWFRVWKLRADNHAQKEIQEVAEQIDDFMSVLYPVCWEALKEYQGN